MKKIVSGLSMLSMLAFAAGCSDDNTWANEANTGKATFALQTGAYSVDASITLTGPGGPVPAVADHTNAELEVALEAGTWTPAMGTWTLYFDADGAGGDPPGPIGDSDDEAPDPVPVAFLGFGDGDGVALGGGTFDITAGQETAVSLRFQVGSDQLVIVETAGTAGFVINANEGACSEICQPGEVCANFNSEAQCLPTCAAPGENAPDCDGGEGTCHESDNPAINVCEPPL